MERFLCIHGHFYQPPRENPWTGRVELQESALPWHDWNHRITAECYLPNASARILDEKGKAEKTVSNYARISFDFGPTLLSWMETEAPGAYLAVLEADKESRRRFGGHGSAMAQGFNHLIFPLANRRDKVTQVVWGIADFERRFGRKPEGMWLPETAVDLETLGVMAERGIRFTVLEPHQSARVRPIGRHDWRPAGAGRLDSTRPYRLNLPLGRHLSLFFYDGPLSRAVAFEGVLNDGAGFTERLLAAFPAGSKAGLVHIATDGETYGHHHKFGEMALAWALEHVASGRRARLTNYSQYLERHPPDHEVEIVEDTAWSCAHGVERWRSDCGCSVGGKGWNQAWRKPLREAMDGLRDALAPLYERAAARLLKDPWASRDAYIQVVLDPSAAGSFLAKRAAKRLSVAERAEALSLLEIQRHAMLMYTSCGWFFDDIGGIEALQVMRYAARAIELAGKAFGRDFERPFLRRLERAKSNRPELGTGRTLYERLVKPDMGR